MARFIALAALLGLAVGLTAAVPDKEKDVPAVLQFKVKGIDGKEVSLADYQGKVILFVNVASKCGYTRQYKTLEALYEKNKDKGFVILGFPCNQFGGQEPGTEEEIQQFCSSKFGVKFPMFAKIEVNGGGRHPLYKTLIEGAPDNHADIKWNFEKFLVSKDGKVVKRFNSKAEPDGKELVAAVDAELAK
jgi:glutathione peroxidase